jgi:hypothetical protein
MSLTRRDLSVIHQALIELEIIYTKGKATEHASEARVLRRKVHRDLFKVPYGYRLAQNVTVNKGWYWRPDDERSFSPQKVFEHKFDAIEDLYAYLAARKPKRRA